jgi:hypothetical protein
MKEDPRFIQAWLKIGERIIRVHKKEAAKPNKARRMMEQYVKWHPPSQSHKPKPRQNPRHQKQDLQPD